MKLAAVPGKVRIAFMNPDLDDADDVIPIPPRRRSRWRIVRVIVSWVLVTVFVILFAKVFIYVMQNDELQPRRPWPTEKGK